jgi:hypothetical protein
MIKYPNTTHVFTVRNFLNIILAVYCLISLSCSFLSPTRETDSAGRIVREVTYDKDVSDTITITKYIGNTEKPLSKEYVKLKDSVPVHSWTEIYYYNKGKINFTKFFVDINSSKVQSGEMTFIYSEDHYDMIEYFSLLDINDKSFFRHGLDIYKYSENELQNRRIIEYEKSQETMMDIQISQYVINYADNKIESMRTRMLDKNTNKIVNNNETDLKIIQEMIFNIEKSLVDRCKGYKLTLKDN